MALIKKINKLAILLVFVLSGYFSARACSGLNTPILTSSVMTGGNLLLNMSSMTLYNCTYSVQIELKCNGTPFTGIAPFYYTSPGFLKTGPAPFPIPQMTVSLAGLCQGGGYTYRWREVYGGFTFSAWSAPNFFTMPGVPIPTTLTLNASPPAICFPQTSQLTAIVSGGCGGGGGLISYSWTPATGLSCVTCSNPIANPTITTTYTCVVKGLGVGSCWTASNVITVSSFTIAPTLGIVSGSNICAGKSNTISISSYSGTLQWQSAGNNAGPWANVAGATSSILITPTLSAGNYCYRLVATGCGGTLNSNTVCTTVFPTPTVIASSSSLCAGQTASLNAGGATSYTWSAGASPIGAPSPTALPLVSTSYTVIGTTNGCTASAVSNITVVPYPVVNLSSNSAVCAGNGINLSATGGGVYQWNGPNAFGTNLQNPTIPNATPVNGGVYTAIVTTSACATTKTINVIVLNPTVSATNTGPYCSTFTVQLNGISTPVLSYAWAGPGFIANTQNASIPNATSSASGIYTLTVNDGTCAVSATTSVTVYPLPVPVAISNAPVCEASILTFTANGGTSYAWSGPNNFSSLNQNPIINAVTPNANGIYSLTVTDLNGCVKSTFININIMPLPIVSISGAYLCIGQTATLTSSGGVSYSWTGPNGFTSVMQNLTLNNITNNEVGDYVVVVTGANSCTLAAGTKIIVYPLPMPIASCSGSVCLNGKVIFQSSGGLLYQWTGPNGFISNEPNTFLNNANSLNYSGTYTLGVTDSKGCKGSTTTNLTVLPLPTATLSANVNNKCIPFCSTFSIAGTAGLQNVQWNMNNGGLVGGTTYTDCFKNSGSYILRSNFSDINGCSNTSTFVINAYPIPFADFHFGPGLPIENDQIEFKDGSIGPEINSWSWYFATNANTSFHQNPTYVFDTPGSFPVTLIISNKWGCKDTVTKAIIVAEDFSLFVPNIFTPNGDGVNDTFQPKGYGIVKYNLQVFDRWGEKLYETTDFTKGWDGTFKGKLSKEESYIWKIVVNNAQGKIKEYTGHVSILK